MTNAPASVALFPIVLPAVGGGLTVYIPDGCPVAKARKGSLGTTVTIRPEVLQKMLGELIEAHRKALPVVRIPAPGKN